MSVDDTVVGVRRGGRLKWTNFGGGSFVDKVHSEAKYLVSEGEDKHGAANLGWQQDLSLSLSLYTKINILSLLQRLSGLNRAGGHSPAASASKTYSSVNPAYQNMGRTIKQKFLPEVSN